MKIACYIRNSAVFEQVKLALVRVGLQPVQFDTETTLLRTINELP